MYSLIIKIILWFPIVLIAFIFGVIGDLLTRLPYLFAPIAFIFLKSCHFIYTIALKDLVHSLKSTPLEKHIPLFNTYFKEEEEK
jgi:hypothetical protein